MPISNGFNPAAVLRPIQSAVGASFLYPLKGIYYYLSHPFLWALFGRRLIPLVVVSIVVLGLLFTFAYLPQLAFLAIFHGHLAWFNAAFLVLGEGQVVIALLFEALLVDETLVNVFDAVLINEGLTTLIAPVRVLFPDAPNPVKQLGKPTDTAVYSPYSLLQILEFIVFLPLNLIPLIGTPAFLIITGARAGPLHHYRYFKLQGLSKKEKKEEIRSRRWKYTWFGTVALLLQLVPVLSMLFLLTTAAGSALWVVQLERQKGNAATSTGDVDARERVQEQGLAGEAEAPPAYTDDPI